MRRLRQSLSLFIAAAALAFVIISSSVSEYFERDLGLRLLYRLRGPLAPPADIALIKLDGQSAAQLGTAGEVNPWPRRAYACLIERLTSLGAKLVVVDVAFLPRRVQESNWQAPALICPATAGMTDETRALGAAISNAHRVLLVQWMNMDFDPDDPRALQLIRREMPDYSLLRESLGAAPFILPKTAQSVLTFSTFLGEGRNDPTLPTLALAADVIADGEAGRGQELARAAGQSPKSLRDIDGPEKIITLIAAELADSSNRKPEGWRCEYSSLLCAFGASIDHSQARAMGLRDVALLASPHFYNHFGGANHLRSVSAGQLLDLDSGDGSAAFDLRNVVAFVGAAEYGTTQQSDSFQTPIGNRYNLQTSGVELLATAFANLKLGNSLNPPRVLDRVLIALLFGAFAIAVHGMRIRTGVALGMVGAGIYLGAAATLFETRNVWLPVVMPCVVLVPVGVFSASAWRASWMRRVFPQFVRWLNVPGAPSVSMYDTLNRDWERRKVEFAACMSTDVVGYTAFAECNSVESTANALQHYHATLAASISGFGGHLLDTAGDGAMAVWAGGEAQASVLNAACKCALDIQRQLSNQCVHDGEFRFTTRIGIAVGNVSLGNMGGAQRFDYKAVGDVPNVASRLQNLNKLLGTSILASAGVVANLDSVPMRRVGTFVLAGKERPVDVFEVVDPSRMAGEEWEPFARAFADARQAHDDGNWGLAAVLLENIDRRWPGDGPTRFYLERCKSGSGMVAPRRGTAVVDLRTT